MARAGVTSVPHRTGRSESERADVRQGSLRPVLWRLHFLHRLPRRAHCRLALPERDPVRLEPADRVCPLRQSTFGVIPGSTPGASWRPNDPVSGCGTSIRTSGSDGGRHAYRARRARRKSGPDLAGHGAVPVVAKVAVGAPTKRAAAPATATGRRAPGLARPPRLPRGCHCGRLAVILRIDVDGIRRPLGRRHERGAHQRRIRSGSCALSASLCPRRWGPSVPRAADRVTSVLDLLDEFYGSVVQNLEPWSAAPPKLRPGPTALAAPGVASQLVSTAISSQDEDDPVDDAQDTNLQTWSPDPVEYGDCRDSAEEIQRNVDEESASTADFVPVATPGTWWTAPVEPSEDAGSDV